VHQPRKIKEKRKLLKKRIITYLNSSKKLGFTEKIVCFMNIDSEFKAEWVTEKKRVNLSCEGEIRRMRLKLDGLFTKNLVIK
jgi:hypothetical protein